MPALLELQLAHEIFDEGLDRVVAEARIGDERGDAGVAALEVFLAGLESGDLQELRGHDFPHRFDRIHFLLLPGVDRKHENQDDRPEAAANAVEKREAEGLG